MKNSVTAQADIFAFDLSDDVLERAAAVADGQRISIGYCTHWYSCEWPLSPGEPPAADRGERPVR
jgi:hypothetical protein